MNTILKSSTYFIIAFLLISCNGLKTKNIVIVNKNRNNLKIVCDSINMLSELRSFFMYFHIENYSNNDIFVTINGPSHGESSRKSFLYISPDNDTLPIFLEGNNNQIRIIKKKTNAYFTQLIIEDYFFAKYNFDQSFHRQSFYNYFNDIIKKSKIIYISDSTFDFKKNLPVGYDTINIIKNTINIDMKNIIINPGPPSPNSLFRFSEKKID